MINWIVSSSILIISVLIIRKVLKGKIAPCIQYALWGIVLLRLLVPFDFGTSSLSLENVTNDVVAVYESKHDDIGLEGRQYVSYAGSYMREGIRGESYGENVVEHTAGHLTVSDTAVEAENDVQPDMSVSKTAQTNTAEAFAQTDKERATVAESEVVSTANDIVITDGKQAVKTLNGVPVAAVVAEFLEHAIEYIGFIGMVVVLAGFMYTNICFAVRVKKQRQLIVPKKKGSLSVYLSAGIETPCLYGVIRPAIYVDAETISNEQVFKHVVEHERTHYRHGDNVWGILRSVAVAIHWYNPLVWAAAIISRKDAELACDAGTIRRLGEAERYNYGATLINMSCKKSERILAMASTMAGSKKSIQERITLIAKKPKTILSAFIAGALVMALVIGGTFTGASNAVKKGMPVQQPAENVTENNVAAVEDVESDATAAVAVADTTKNIAKGTAVASNVNVMAIPIDPYEENKDKIPLLAKIQTYSQTCNVIVDDINYANKFLFGKADSIDEIFAERMERTFRPFTEEELLSPLVTDMYYLHNGDSVNLCIEGAFENHCFASYYCTPENIEYMISLLGQYMWKNVDSIDISESEYSIRLQGDMMCYWKKTMTFYDIGLGVVDFYDGARHTYWEAMPLSAGDTSIAETLYTKYFSSNVELKSMIIEGSMDCKEAADFFADMAYPYTRKELEKSNPYWLEDIGERSSGITWISENCIEGNIKYGITVSANGSIRGECLVSWIATRNDSGDWCFTYYDLDIIDVNRY